MKKYFLAGLVILLPLAIALMSISFLMGLLTGPFIDIATAIIHRLHIPWLSSPTLVGYASQLLILILLFLATLLLGAIARTVFLNSLLKLGDQLLKKIPIFNTVYKTTRDIIRQLFMSNKTAFQKVVLVPFPHKDVYTLGLISREAPNSCSHATEQDLISVFIPTTPNPTTGFLLMFPQNELIPVNLSPEEAIKYILSCGVIIPEGKEPSA